VQNIEAGHKILIRALSVAKRPMLINFILLSRALTEYQNRRTAKLNQVWLIITVCTHPRHTGCRFQHIV